MLSAEFSPGYFTSTIFHLRASNTKSKLLHSLQSLKSTTKR
ncbi:MAG: hypothetical protein AVDCRST_MAG96-1760 [uncultured Segetibacter sp.]|uniref:Uncharacterized protein n=1 Tax=uncultured Segetibacter sp. TaxID=481133 RepID=A0A6J4SID8_9BACT|nr:MAG: hypothetical protein AVDCRST_MAG96-1760 [uncultured Segetibacter sp.]